MSTDKQKESLYWDIEILLSRHEIANGFLPLLIETFATEAPLLIKKMQIAVEAEDRNMLKQFCHKLKGMSANIGAIHLSKLCREIEEREYENDLSTIKSTINKIGDVFEQTLKEYKETQNKDFLSLAFRKQQ